MCSSATNGSGGSGIVKKLRVGVIGAGKISAGSHLPCLAKFNDVELILCEVDEARLRLVADQYAIRETRTDYRAMLADDALDAVFVLTPPPVTYSVARDCLAAAIDTIMEKPPARNRVPCPPASAIGASPAAPVAKLDGAV